MFPFSLDISRVGILTSPGFACGHAIPELDDDDDVSPARY